jgi:hypothetical protein
MWAPERGWARRAPADDVCACSLLLFVRCAPSLGRCTRCAGRAAGHGAQNGRACRPRALVSAVLMLTASTPSFIRRCQGVRCCCSLRRQLLAQLPRRQRRQAARAPSRRRVRRWQAALVDGLRRHCIRCDAGSELAVLPRMLPAVHTSAAAGALRAHGANCDVAPSPAPTACCALAAALAACLLSHHTRCGHALAPACPPSSRLCGDRHRGRAARRRGCRARCVLPRARCLWRARPFIVRGIDGHR